MSICNKNKKNNNYNKNSDDNNNNNNNNDASPMRRSPSFYRRPLPSHLTAFSSHTGRTVFREALECGFMEQYFPLAEQYHTQSEPAYCGLGTLAMILNALQIDPDRQWKGPWRWFSEELLDCCVPLEQVKKQGITMNEFACLARCNGAAATVYYADQSSEDEFRQILKQICSKDRRAFLALSYDRKTLKQTGSGHFSPVAGYNPQRDIALVLDVARFKYPSYWVDVSELWKSLLPLDSALGRSRGFVIVEKAPTHITTPTVLHISFPNVKTRSLYARLYGDIHNVIIEKSKYKSNNSTIHVHNLIKSLIDILPHDTLKYNDLNNNNNNNNKIINLFGIHTETPNCSLTCGEHCDYFDDVLSSIRSLAFHRDVKQVVSDVFQSPPHIDVDLFTMLLMAFLHNPVSSLPLNMISDHSSDSINDNLKDHNNNIENNNNNLQHRELLLDEDTVPKAVRDEVLGIQHQLEVLSEFSVDANHSIN